MPNHIVQQGESLAGIARSYGFASAQRILDLPENSELRRLRPHPDLLYPGDQVFIPERTAGTESKPSGQKHRFRAQRARRQLRLRLRILGEALADEPYTLEIDGEELESGTTSADGELCTPIPPKAQCGCLRIGGFALQLELLRLDPVTRVEGIQARLNNLGYGAGRVDGSYGLRTSAAMASFQANQDGLEVERPGAPEPATLTRLSEVHDGVATDGDETLDVTIGEARPPEPFHEEEGGDELGDEEYDGSEDDHPGQLEDD